MIGGGAEQLHFFMERLLYNIVGHLRAPELIKSSLVV